MTIKETRIKYGLTIKQVSNLTGVPYRSLQNWEAGIRKCPDYVENTIVNILDQKFGKPDHQMFLEELVEQLKSDIQYAPTYDMKRYIQDLKGDIMNHLAK